MALGAIGCGGDSSGDSNQGSSNGGDSAEDTLNLHFDPMYSAYDGVHEFQLPVIVEDVSGATFRASDPSMVTIEQTADGATLTMRKAGKVTIIASTPDGQTGRATLTISAATPEAWQSGSERYNNGMGLDGGVRLGPGGGNLTGNTELACTTCHGVTAQTFGDVEHTPQQTGGYSDDQLIKIFTMAQKPAGIGQHTNVSLSSWQSFHKWSATDAQKRGLVVYLRSLAPKAQGTLDFGGFRPRGDGGMGRPRRDGGTSTDAGVM